MSTNEEDKPLRPAPDGEGAAETEAPSSRWFELTFRRAAAPLKQFSGGAQCATAPSELMFDDKTCGGNRDLGLLKSLAVTTGNDIDVLMCTHRRSSE